MTPTADAPALSQEALRLLEKHHDFPGPYMFKAIGFATPGFLEEVRRAARGVLGGLDECQVTCRNSSGRRYLSVTLEAQVSGGEQVLAMYAALRRIEGLVVLV